MVIARYDDGHCAVLGTNGHFVRYFMGTLLFYDKLRDLVPAAVHRFDRCSDDDVQVIVTLYYAVVGTLGSGLGPPPPTARFLGRPASEIHAPPSLATTPGNTGEGFSNGFFYHVALSEMWYAPGEVTLDEATDAWKETTMSTGLETWLAAKVDWWPTYDKDAYWAEIADYDGPLLMLQGGLDPATTAEPALALAEHFDGPAQTLAWFPQGAHGLINGSTLPDGSNCGEALFLAFLDAPSEVLDTSCTEDVLGVQWDGYSDYNQYFMGTQDIWGDEAR